MENTKTAFSGPSVTYCGRILPGREPTYQLFRNGRPWAPIRPEGKEDWWSIPICWGESTAGARLLAWLLLFDTLKSQRAADKWHIDFAQQIVRNLPQSWWLLQSEVRDWYSHAKPTSALLWEEGNGEKT
jgi:hypothetical protein